MKHSETKLSPLLLAIFRRLLLHKFWFLKKGLSNDFHGPTDKTKSRFADKTGWERNISSKLVRVFVIAWLI